jgi:hypothetical protein
MKHLIPMGAITAETLELAKAAFGRGPTLVPGGLQKAGINLAENLVGINLEAPSKKLFPVYSPLRNRVSRKAAAFGATATSWKSVKKINSTKVLAQVAEKLRNASVTTLTEDRSATFKSFGLDDFVTHEALAASKGFEDVRAMSALQLLYAVMIAEEQLILGGNVTNIGAPAGVPATSVSAGPVNFGAGTYSFKVTAITLDGHIIEASGRTAGVDSAGESLESTVSGAQIVGAAEKVTVTWADVKGAVSYNVFAKLAADPLWTLQTPRRVTTNSWTNDAAYVITVPVPNVADKTGDALAFDGFIPQIQRNVDLPAAQYITKNNGVLTADGANGITEFDDLLAAMWNNFNLGPTMILVNAAQARDVTKKIISGSGTPVSRIMLQDGERNIVGSLYVGSYLNKFASSFAEGFPNDIPIKIHPKLPPGTILFIVEQLPYPNNQVPNVWEIETRQEYTQYDFAMTDRSYPFGIYGQQVLKGYFSACHGVIKNIKEG